MKIPPRAAGAGAVAGRLAGGIAGVLVAGVARLERPHRSDGIGVVAGAQWAARPRAASVADDRRTGGAHSRVSHRPVRLDRSRTTAANWRPVWGVVGVYAVGGKSWMQLSGLNDCRAGFGCPLVFIFCVGTLEKAKDTTKKLILYSAVSLTHSQWPSTLHTWKTRAASDTHTETGVKVKEETVLCLCAREETRPRGTNDHRPAYKRV